MAGAKRTLGESVTREDRELDRMLGMTAARESSSREASSEGRHGTTSSSSGGYMGRMTQQVFFDDKLQNRAHPPPPVAAPPPPPPYAPAQNAAAYGPTPAEIPSSRGYEMSRTTEQVFFDNKHQHRAPPPAVVPPPPPPAPAEDAAVHAGDDYVHAHHGGYIGPTTTKIFFDGQNRPNCVAPVPVLPAAQVPPKAGNDCAGADRNAAARRSSSRLRNLCRQAQRGAQGSGWDAIREYLASIETAGGKKLVAENVEGRHLATPLHLVCCRDPPPDVVEVLIQASARPVQWPDANGMLPIHAACMYRASAEVVKLLVDAFPESLCKLDDKRRTPLHWATRNMKDRPPDPEVLTLVIRRGLVSQRDSDGRTPIQSFSSQTKKVSVHQRSEVHKAKRCLGCFLDCKPEGTSAYLSAIQGLPSYARDDAVTHPHTKRILNRMIAKRFPTSILFIDLYVYVLLIASFALAVQEFIGRWYLDLLSSENIEDLLSASEIIATGVSGWTIAFMYGGAAYLILRQITQASSLSAARLFKAWFWYPWNWLNIANICLVFSSATVMHKGTGEGEHIRGLLIATGGILWLQLAAFLRTTRLEFAVFVSGAIHIMWILIPFLLFAALVLGAFAQMYYIDATTSPACYGIGDDSDSALTFCYFSEAFLKTFAMFVGGGVEEEAFATSVSVAWLTSAFALLAIILLLTVLIAIVTDSYSKVKSQSEVVFWWHRFNYAFEMNAVLNFLWSRHSLSSEPTEEDDKLRTLFDIIRLEFDSPHDYTVYQARKESQRKWKGPKWFFSDARELKPSWYKRVLLAVIVPSWMLAGFVTVGWLWPPQVREFLFSHDVPEELQLNKTDINGSCHQPESEQRTQGNSNLDVTEGALELKEDFQDLKSSLLRSLERVERSMAEKSDKMKSSLENGMDSVKTEIKDIKAHQVINVSAL
uniref:Ion transport domain-containing protein n=1 Tax=Odontella aurita TaxID=265563 RepID=A0A7S4MNM5_9STRA